MLPSHRSTSLLTICIHKLLLLCLCDCFHQRQQYPPDSHRDQAGESDGQAASVLVIDLLCRRMQTIERMREMSRFTCELEALVDGECESGAETDYSAEARR